MPPAELIYQVWIDIAKHFGKKASDGRTDGYWHGIIKPFFKSAYKNEVLDYDSFGKWGPAGKIGLNSVYNAFIQNIRPSRPKAITSETPSRACDHLSQTWNESIQNIRCYTVDHNTMLGFRPLLYMRLEWAWHTLKLVFEACIHLGLQLTWNHNLADGSANHYSMTRASARGQDEQYFCRICCKVMAEWLWR